MRIVLSIFSICALLFLAACATNAPLAQPVSPQPSLIPVPSVMPSPLNSPPSAQQTGKLTGHVTIGPLRPGPVRGDETPAPVSPEVYAARTIQILAANGATLITSVKINPDGNYQVDLPAGNYVVALARSGIDRAGDLPKNITIEAGKTVRLDIDIDTGMR
jgi:hypothetical protein